MDIDSDMAVSVNFGVLEKGFRAPLLGAQKRHVNIRIRYSGQKAHYKGISETMVCRILLSILGYTMSSYTIL